MFFAIMAREKVFKFKQFDLLNDKTAMKVGTDGVLLGAWCDVAGAKLVLDVGTGCGLIALMLAQRNAVAYIEAIDIDDDAVAEAKLNINNSPWNNRVEALLADFNEYETTKRYDLIVSNPPFFDNGVEAPDARRNKARHSTSLSYEQLISKSKDLLVEDGVLAIITPMEAENEIRRCAVKHHMCVKRLCEVVPIAGNPPKRLMWELVKTEVDMNKEVITICSSDKTYTQQYVVLTRDFYLKM